MTGDISDRAMALRAWAVRRALDGMTQEGLADRLGVTLSAVKSWESPSGSSGIRAKHVGRLSQIAGIRSDFIIAGEISDVVIPPTFWAAVRANLAQRSGALRS